MKPLLFVALQLSLWVVGTHAFFPYYPQSRCSDDPVCTTEEKIDAVTTKEPSAPLEGRTFKLSQREGGDNERQNPPVKEVASRARRKYANRGVRVGTEPLQRRKESVYKIVSATTPTAPQSEGINQDGTDFSYFVEIGIGSNQKPIYLLVDTGAGTTWVMSSTCESSPCAIHQTFGPPDSDTLTVEDNPFEIHYGSGSVSGLTAKDTIHIAGIEMEFQFGLANVTSDDFNHFPFDGILGLAMAKGKSENLIEELIAEEVLDQNIFGVYLNRASDGDTGGEISFGTLNPDKYRGEITYTKLKQPNRGDWAIDLDDITYGDKGAGVATKLAFIDTGTSYAFGPKADVAKVYSLIDGASTKDGTTYNVPCDSSQEVAISFSGRRFVLSPKDWLSKPDSSGVCTGNIYAIEVVKGAWLLGDVFLKNVYAIFDADNKQIGFATRPIITVTTSAIPTMVTSPPGTVMQGSGYEEDTTLTTTVVIDTAVTTSYEPAAAASAGDHLSTSAVYTIVSVVAVIAAIAS